MITGIINIILLLRIRGVGFVFRFDRIELFRLMRAGIGLTLSSIIYGAVVGIVDNTIISKYLQFDQLGLFIFITFMTMISQGLKELARSWAYIYGDLNTA